MGKYTQEEINFLIENYPQKGKLWCCERLGRTEASVRGKASELKLKQDRNSDFFKDWQRRAAESKVGKKRPEHSKLMARYTREGRLPVMGNCTEERKREISIQKKEWYKNNEHPKGFLGHKHKQESIDKIVAKIKKSWSDPKSYVNSDEYRQVKSDIQVEKHKKNPNMYKNNYSRAKNGYYDINGVTHYFRSLWEPNYALYLDFLISKGQIKSWEYEPDTFWFEKIKRGVRSYTPDFKVENIDGTLEYHEVKGYMDAKSKTKLKRMRIYYPEIKMVLIAVKEYREVLSKTNGVIKYYE